MAQRRSSATHEERHAHFGDALRDLRRAAGLTQEELAARARLSAKAISALERGVNAAPRRETLLLLAKALRLSAPERAAFESAARRPVYHDQRSAPSAAAALALHSPTSSGALHPPSGTPLIRQPALVAPARFVGRAAELELIALHLSYATPPVLLLAGEPGIGKTRLLREARARAAAAGFAVVEGGCSRRSGQELYAPLPSALARYLTGLDASQMHAALEGCGWLARLLPELAEQGLTAPPGLPPEQERRLIFQAAVHFLANIANVTGPAGTLLVLDDLQWASPDTLDLLASLARAGNASRLRILAACRNADRQPQAPLWEAVTDLVREELAQRADLTPLSTGEAEELLDDLLHGLLGHEEVYAIIQRTGGVPFFLVSCAHTPHAPGGASAGVAVPWTVAQSVRQRIAALPGEGAQVLGAAAVVGRSVPLSLLSTLGERINITSHELCATVDAACRERLLVEDGPNGVQFAHDLIREAAEADLGHAQRAALHRWTAEALERAPGEPVAEVLAYHYSMAGEREQAVMYLGRVAERAERLRAHAEAARALDELAEHLDALGRPVEAAGARERQGVALTTAARYDEALASLERAVEVYEACGDADALARVLARIGDVHALRATSDEGIARLQGALRAFSEPGPSAHALAALHVSLAWLINTTGRYSEALPVAERGAALAEAARDTTLLVQASLRRGHLLLMLQRIDEGICVFREALPLVEAGNDLRALRFALNNLGWIHEARGDFATDRDYTERALDAAIRLDDPSLIAYMRSNHGGPAFNRGDWQQARADFEQGLALLRHIRSPWASAWPPLLLGQLRVAEGRHDEGTSLLEEAIACATRVSDLQAQRWAHGTLAERELAEGQPERALARLEPLRDASGECVIDVTVLLPLLAWAYADVGQVTQAVATVEEAIRRAEAGRLLPALAGALRARALLRHRKGQWDHAREDLMRALALDRRMGYPYDEAKTLYRLGEIALSKGRRSQAHKHLAAASRILSRLGERLYHEHVQQALAGLLLGRAEAAALDAQPRAELVAALQAEKPNPANTSPADGMRAIGGRAGTPALAAAI